MDLCVIVIWRINCSKTLQFLRTQPKPCLGWISIVVGVVDASLKQREKFSQNEHGKAFFTLAGCADLIQSREYGIWPPVRLWWRRDIVLIDSRLTLE